MPKVNDEYPGKKPVNAQISDAEMIAKAKENYSKDGNTKKVEHKFPTEIVDLPSKGLLYPKGHPLAKGTIEMKYMTAKEEDILTNQSFIKQGIVLDKLFKAVLVV